MNLLEKYINVRKYSEEICAPLKTEDYVVQPIGDVSPPKWHIGHTTWFFETFILKPNVRNYVEYDPEYNYVFNSYYETVGARVIRTDRGNLSRPAVEDVYKFRKHVDGAMEDFLSKNISKELQELVTIGLNHEQQHQELLWTDIKYILGNNPLFPAYKSPARGGDFRSENIESNFIQIEEGIYDIGYNGDEFCFDNELSRHKVFINDFAISNRLVTNGAFLEFMDAGGYGDFNYWHAEGWDWVKTNNITAPLYWHFINGEWYQYTYEGLKRLNPSDELCHISFYEAAAFASWKGMRLPTEFEWEIAAQKFEWGSRWEWTESAYLPYPGFAKAPGAIGEYNGKFMVNQKVLKGASAVTSPGHSRITYRNFFHPHLRWQYTGLRLVQ
ncbi:MAG: ergothioneine biosynthesis protein EgtB [Ginsengibacter sp.]